MKSQQPKSWTIKSHQPKVWTIKPHQPKAWAIKLNRNSRKLEQLNHNNQQLEQVNRSSRKLKQLNHISRKLETTSQTTTTKSRKTNSNRSHAGTLSSVLYLSIPCFVLRPHLPTHTCISYITRLSKNLKFRRRSSWQTPSLPKANVSQQCVVVASLG